MPKLSANDEYVKLVAWLVDDGEQVKKDDALMLIESSKKSGEVVAPQDGILSIVVKGNTAVKVGTLIGNVGDTMVKHHSEELPVLEKKQQGMITEKAKKLIREHGVDIALLPKNKIIKERSERSTRV